jgi:hypothetical protein
MKMGPFKFTNDREADLKDGGEFPRLDVRLLKKLAEKYIVKATDKRKYSSY